MTGPKPISRELARERGLLRYFTGKPCKHGHVAERLLSNRECVVCARLRDVHWLNTPKGKAYQRQYRETPKMRDYHREYSRKRYLEKKAANQSVRESCETEDRLRALKPKEILQLLRAEVTKAGGQEAWAKKAGIDRALVNKVIHQKRPVSRNMMKALGLRVVIVKD